MDIFYKVLGATVDKLLKKIYFSMQITLFADKNMPQSNSSTVALSPEVREKLYEKAKEEGKSQRGLVDEALRQYLGMNPKKSQEPEVAEILEEVVERILEKIEDYDQARLPRIFSEVNGIGILIDKGKGTGAAKFPEAFTQIEDRMTVLEKAFEKLILMYQKLEEQLPSLKTASECYTTENNKQEKST